MAYVLWYEYLDHSAAGVIAVFNDKEQAEAVLGILRMWGDSARSYIVSEFKTI
jgi:hypothetical protein